MLPTPNAQPSGAGPGQSSHLLLALITRVHFLAGLFVGPFVFIAALSGLLYALTPQVEQQLYAEQLRTDSRGPSLPLAQQIEAAKASLSVPGSLAAVRPAVGPGFTTRIMFSVQGIDDFEHLAVFVDPVTANVLGEVVVYGTTGVLPLRNWIGDMHRRLFLGEWGRVYSELAASWLWLVALGGLMVWQARWRRHAHTSQARPGGLRRWHSTLGLGLLIGMLFFSATGLTWSKFAGENIGELRGMLGMGTPGLDTRLGPATPGSAGHSHHATASEAGLAGQSDVSRIDAVLAAARQAGIDANNLEIRPAPSAEHAWAVVEIDRSWPTQVDAVAIDPAGLQVVHRVEFARFPLAAKLTRWGIDAHMGSLFGWFNQLLLVLTAAGVLAMVVLGYLIWWRRRPRTTRSHYQGVLTSWQQLGWRAKSMTVIAALLLGFALPVLGCSVVVLLVLDGLLAVTRNRRGANDAVAAEI